MQVRLLPHRLCHPLHFYSCVCFRGGGAACHWCPEPSPLARCSLHSAMLRPVVLGRLVPLVSEGLSTASSQKHFFLKKEKKEKENIRKKNFRLKRMLCFAFYIFFSLVFIAYLLWMIFGGGCKQPLTCSARTEEARASLG